MSKRKTKMLIKIGVYGGVIYTAWCGVLYFLQDRVMFPREYAGASFPKPFHPRTEVLEVSVEGGTVYAWFIPAPHASADRPAPVVVYCHGNAELIDHQVDVVEGYQQLGVSVLLIEYRGYGRAAGKPSQEAITEDAAAFYDLLVARDDVDADRVVMHGRSIGAAVAAQLGADRPAAALVLDTPFSSAASMSWGYGVPPLLVKHPWRTDRVLRNLEAPVLISHGEDDGIIPVKHSKKLHKIAKGSQLELYDAGHNDFPGYGDAAATRYWGTLADFLARHGVISPRARS